jgi:hypothetical protein
MVALVKDKRGAILVQTMVILPIFILIVFGGFEVWKVMSVKQSLTSGTSEAARYLSFNHRDVGDRDTAEGIIYKELSNNDLIGNTSFDLDIRYYELSDDLKLVGPIPDPTTLSCWKVFRVEAKLTLPWTIIIPGLSPKSGFSITDRQVGKTFCR